MIEDAIGAVLLWGIASLSVGATLGFLFGIPKSASAPAKAVANGAAANPAQAGADADANPPASPGRANTNLEEVSDWLTKIVVGLTLVNWGTIQSDILTLSEKMAASFGAGPTVADVSFASALLVGFFTIGFLLGYLYTRMFLQGAFSRSDRDMATPFHDVLQREMRSNAADAGTSAQALAPAVPSANQLRSAERVRQLAPPNDPQAVLTPLRALAAEYEGIRIAGPKSPERTRAMSEVVNRMMTLALTAVQFIDQFATSASSGERLIAVVTLKARFDPGWIEWLAKRLVGEATFISVQAAGALLVGVRLAGPEDKARLRELVLAAQKELAEKELVDAERDKLIEQILTE